MLADLSSAGIVGRQKKKARKMAMGSVHGFNEGV